MKRFILSLALIFTCLSIQAQNRYFGATALPDTIGADSTITYEWPGNFGRLGVVTTQVVADSLSGATDASVAIQYSLTPGGTDWYTKNTVTINGPGESSGVVVDSLAGPIRIRFVFSAGSGTQSTALRVLRATWRDL